MARIVCQVLHRSDRISFLWSEGTASFEPYHVEGAERANLLQLAEQIHAKLPTADGAELTQLGQQLYRAVFRRDASAYGSAEEIQGWLAKLLASNSIEKLEFLSDAPGLIPWNLLIDEASNQFWGARFTLGAGRRVNALRQNPAQGRPKLRFAADLDLVQQLSAAQMPLLDPLREAGKLLHTTTSLEDDLEKLAPDILLLLVRFEAGQLHLGTDSFGIDELQKWIAEPKEGNPDPLIILMGVGAPAEQAAWQRLLGTASATFSGLVANEALLSAPKAFDVGHRLAEQFAEGKQCVGEILRTLRAEQGSAALAFSAFCPPQVRVVDEGATDGPGAELPIEVAPLPRSPYRPFAAFEQTDRALFFGREEETLRGALVTDQAETLGVLLHGSPAVGKTSYLQAGLLPYLEQECVGYRVLRDRSPLDSPVAEKDYPILILRCTGDLVGQFADALSVFCAQPFVYTTPTGSQVTADLPNLLHQMVTGVVPANTAIKSSTAQTGITATPGEMQDDENTEGISPRELWIALRDNKDLLAKILDTITQSLPFELVIAVDQGEELLTQVHTAKEQARRQKAVDMLVQVSRVAPRCKIVYTIRSQSLGEFVSLFPDGRAPADWRAFYLRPLTEAELVDALLWPTNREEVPYCGEIPYQKYGFAFEDGMAEQIVAEAIEASTSEQQGPLPLIQASGALLYERQVLERKQEILRAADVKEFGGVKDALNRYLAGTLDRLPVTKQSRQALRELIGKLYTSHADGTLSRDLLPASELKNYWANSPDPVEPIVNQAAEEQGLFEIQQLLIGGQQDVFVSLPQDSLAQLGRRIGNERDRQLLAKTKVLDVLWIMVPLLFLAAAITFWGTRYYAGRQMEELLTETKKDKETLVEKAKEAIENNEKILKGALKESRLPQYYGVLAQADLALRGDNALRARQLLLSQPAMRAYSENQKENTLPELRGFEWKYLWRRLNSERLLLEGHRSIVTSVAVSSDSQRAASASADGTVRIWNLANGEVIALIPGSKTAVNAVAFAPDGKALASAGAEKIVRVWDISKLTNDYLEITSPPKALAGHEGAIHALAFGKDANSLASAGADKSVILWDTATGKPKHTLKEHTATVRALAFSSDGALVSGGDDAQFIVYDGDTGKKRNAIKTAYRTIAALAISSDAKTLATGGAEAKLDAELGTIRFWNLADGKETGKSIEHGSGVLALAFGPDGKTIASGGNDRIVRLWEVQSAKQQHSWIGHLGFVSSLAFTKDGGSLVSGSIDSTVKVWNPTQSSGADVIQAHADWVQKLVLNPKNTLLASGSRDGSVKLWDPKTSKLLKDLPAHNGAVTALAFSSHKDATFLAVGTRDEKNSGEIKVWQIELDPKQGYTVKEASPLKEQTKGVTCLAFHPSDEKADVLISGGVDRMVKVWDVKTGKEKQAHAGHKEEVRCVAFAFDGVTFASAGKDGLVCIYELESKEIRTLADLHIGSIEAITLFQVPLSRGDDHEIAIGILTGGADQAMRMWAFDQHDRNPVGRPRKISAYRTHAQPLTSILHQEMNNGLVASASWDGTIKLYDLYTERFTLTGHQGAVRALAIAADQSFLASAGNDGTIRIWRTHPERRADQREKK